MNNRAGRNRSTFMLVLAPARKFNFREGRRTMILFFFLPLLGSFVAGFFGRFLGSEGSAFTGKSLLLFALILFCGIFFFRRYSLKLKEKCGFRLLVVINLVFVVLVTFFSYQIKLHLLAWFGLWLSGILKSIFILSVSDGPYLSPGPGNSSSASEDSFGIGVLMEPWPITQNSSLESSLHQRIIALENENSPFLLGKEKGEYWREVKSELTNSSSQSEYNLLVDFENRDLEIRERKHSCYRHFSRILDQEPSLSENFGYNSQEVLIDFLNEKRTKLDEMGGDVVVRDRREITFLTQLADDLQRHGRHSKYMKEILNE